MANTTTAVNGEVTAEAGNIDAHAETETANPERIAEFFTGLETVEPG